MAKVFIRDDAGVRALLQSQEMQAVVEQYAQSRAGADGEISSFIGFDRAKAIIKTSNKE